MRGRAVLMLALLAMVTACAGTAVRPDLAYEGTYNSYSKILANWTRTSKLYHNFSTELIVSATYFSLPMRQAFAAEWARAFDLPADEARLVLDEQLEQHQRQVEFVVAFYTPKRQYNDLDETDSTWRLWFIDAGGRKVGAAKIEEVKVKHRREFFFYPTYNEYARLYRVIFPVVGEDQTPLTREQGAVTLRVTGVPGTVDLRWEMPPVTE